MKAARERFDWDGPDDSAVPLETLISSDEVEDDLGPSDPRGSLRSQRERPPSSRPAIRPLLLASLLCIGAFAHGWTTGTAVTRENAAPPCDGDHCHIGEEQ